MAFYRENNEARRPLLFPAILFVLGGMLQYFNLTIPDAVHYLEASGNLFSPLGFALVMGALGMFLFFEGISVLVIALKEQWLDLNRLWLALKKQEDWNSLLMTHEK
jgi:hypothetical protein